MPDFLTVAISVAATLTAQATYFVFMKLPGSLKRSKAALRKLEVREHVSYSVYEAVRHEISTQTEVLDRWKSGVVAIKEGCEEALIDRDYFRQILPELTVGLGRLQGVTPTIKSQYPTDPLPDVIWLFEQARRVSKVLASFGNFSKVDLLMELSDMELVEEKMLARFRQVKLEADILQAELSEQITLLEADLAEIRSKFYASTLLLAGILSIGLVFSLDLYLIHLHMHMAIRLSCLLFASCLITWLASISRSKIYSRASRSSFSSDKVIPIND